MIRSNLSLCLVNCAGQICFVHQSQYVKDDVWSLTVSFLRKGQEVRSSWTPHWFPCCSLFPDLLSHRVPNLSSLAVDKTKCTSLNSCVYVVKKNLPKKDVAHRSLS